MSSTETKTDPITLYFGFIELLPWRWVTNELGEFGQQYMRIDYDMHGNEVSREIREPAAWLSYE